MALMTVFETTDMFDLPGSGSDAIDASITGVTVRHGAMPTYQLYGYGTLTFDPTMPIVTEGVITRLMFDTSDDNWLPNFMIADLAFSFPGAYFREVIVVGNVAKVLADALAGNDSIAGSAGNDTLRGFFGNDTIDGGLGGDYLEGGFGNDAYYVDTNDDSVRESASAGNDTVYASASFALHLTLAYVEVLRTTDNKGTAAIDLRGSIIGNLIVGNAGTNLLEGRDGNDTQNALIGNDTLDGGTGNDVLNGAGGADVLIGGLGADRLIGGPGPDRFDFNSTAETPVGAGRDRIVGFATKQGDRIDLSDLDANLAVPGNQAFVFITTAFTGIAGELRATASQGNRIVQGDVDGDKVADFHILVQDVASLSSSDFYL